MLYSDFTLIFGLKVDFRIASGQEGQLVLSPYVTLADEGLENRPAERDVRESKLKHTIARSNVLVAEAAHDHAGFVHGLRDGVEEASACAAAHLVHVEPSAHTVLVQEGRQSTRVHPAQARLSIGCPRALAHGVQRVLPAVGDEHIGRLVLDTMVAAAHLGQLLVEHVEQVGQLVLVAARLLHDNTIVAAYGGKAGVLQPTVCVPFAELDQQIVLLDYIGHEFEDL